ncbi:MAG TPA: hypothetical protein VM008_10095 [Phycisphaerae bacterium]|nr:hypothetical protein [Phycisphaerae bacterium]
MFFGKKNNFEGREREPRFYEVPWIRSLIRLCVVLLVIAGLIESYHAVKAYGNRVVRDEFTEQADGAGGVGVEKIALSAELKNKPAWLDKAILDSIFSETQKFAARDQATYNRLLNPLDKDVLKEIAENYTGTDASGVNHWTLRDNAWIRKITEVRRVVAKDAGGRKSETIEIYAEYRQPAAWVQYGDKFYLVDGDFVRLPGEYSRADRDATEGLMAITNVDLPDGVKSVPQPSESWQTEDLAAGMKLVDLLQSQPFMKQIATIDMANYKGRKDSLKPWILLNTTFQAADGSPRVIRWGRSIGDEKFYEVSAAAKVQALNEIFLRFARIDANHDYVDIRTEQVLLPKDPEPQTADVTSTN